MQNFMESESLNCHQVTYINMYKYTFKWTLQDINKYDDTEIKSDTFYPDNKGTWWLSFSIGKYINLKLCRNGVGYGPVICDCMVQLFNFDNVLILQEYLRMQYLNNNNCGSCSIISGLDMLVSDMKTGKMQDSINITVFLEIQEKVSENINYCPNVEDTLRGIFLESVVKDLSIMFDDQINTNVVFEVSGETIGAHKSILSARSPVFAKMFKQDMSENQTCVVKVPDVTPFALKELVAFIYGKYRLSYDFQECLDVYYAADKYEMLKLKDLCGALLRKNRTVQNVGQILQLFELHNDIMMKSNTLAFIRQNIESCIKMDWWEELMREQSTLTKELEKLKPINK